MTLGALAAAVILGLITNEFSDVSPWLGRKLVQWSTRLRYGNSPRAGVRAEELAAVINDRPGKLFKLGTGIGFAAAAMLARVRQLLAPRSAANADSIPEGALSAARPIRLAEDEPSRAVSRYLFPTEKFRGEWRRHWIHPAKSVLTVMLIATLASIAAERRLKPAYVAPSIAGIAAAAALLAVFRVLGWYVARFVITNKRLMSTEGLVFRQVAMLPLARVTDVRYVQSPLGRMLSYATFKLESASRRNRLRKIVNLPNPNELYLRLIEEIYEPEAVEARLSGFGTYPDTPADPEATRQDIIFEIGVLSVHLSALAEAIERLAPHPVQDPAASATTGSEEVRP